MHLPNSFKEIMEEYFKGDKFYPIYQTKIPICLNSVMLLRIVLNIQLLASLIVTSLQGALLFCITTIPCLFNTPIIFILKEIYLLTNPSVTKKF